MSTLNKIKVQKLHVEVDFMYTGCVISLAWGEPDQKEPIKYTALCSRRSLGISRFRDWKWEEIIPPDYTMNPLDITPEEEMMVDILPGLSQFEREFFRVVGVIARMWHNDASEDYAKKYLLEFLKDHLEQVP